MRITILIISTQYHRLIIRGATNLRTSVAFGTLTVLVLISSISFVYATNYSGISPEDRIDVPDQDDVAASGTTPEPVKVSPMTTFSSSGYSDGTGGTDGYGEDDAQLDDGPGDLADR